MDDQLAINMALTRLRDGYNTGNVQQILSVYSSAVALMVAGQPSFSREEAEPALRATLTRLFEQYMVEMIPVTAQIRLFGDFAFLYGWQELRMTPRAGGAVKVDRLRLVQLWQKEDAGEWRIRMHMDNEDVAPALAAAWVANGQRTG